MAVYSFEHYSDEQHAATKEACEKVYEVLNGLSKKSFEDGGGRELGRRGVELRRAGHWRAVVHRRGRRPFLASLQAFAMGHWGQERRAGAALVHPAVLGAARPTPIGEARTLWLRLAAAARRSPG